MFNRNDSLEILNSSRPLKEKLIVAHKALQEKFSFIARIAITLYDPQTKVLKTYMHSSGDDNPMAHYQSLLEEAPSLARILKEGRPRVVNNMLTFENNGKEHSDRIARQGYQASYTMPMFNNGEFFGFLFFNSYETDVFTDKILCDLDTFGHLISLMLINDFSVVKMLNAAIKTSSDMVHRRDPETGSHLDRMSRYSRLIAKALADEYNLDDDYIEHVFMFSPLHDIGKLSIPDNILLKPEKLSDEEWEVMQTHPTRGLEIIDDLIVNFGLDKVNRIDVLRNIAESHHEAVNGTGYPNGTMLEDIPLEARIVAVADVFDALTTRRPYKKAWSNESAIEMLNDLAGEKLDRRCVEVLIENMEEVEEIQKKFKENEFG